MNHLPKVHKRYSAFAKHNQSTNSNILRFFDIIFELSSDCSFIMHLQQPGNRLFLHLVRFHLQFFQTLLRSDPERRKQLYESVVQSTLKEAGSRFILINKTEMTWAILVKYEATTIVEWAFIAMHKEEGVTPPIEDNCVMPVQSPPYLLVRQGSSQSTVSASIENGISSSSQVEEDQKVQRRQQTVLTASTDLPNVPFTGEIPENDHLNPRTATGGTLHRHGSSHESLAELVKACLVGNRKPSPIEAATRPPDHWPQQVNLIDVFIENNRLTYHQGPRNDLDILLAGWEEEGDATVHDEDEDEDDIDDEQFSKIEADLDALLASDD